MASKYTPNTGNYPAYNNHNSPRVHCTLTKALNACSQLQTTKQVVSVKEQGEWSANKIQPKVVICEYCRDLTKMSWPLNITKVSKNCGNGTNALSFDPISQLNKDSDQKGGNY